MPTEYTKAFFSTFAYAWLQFFGVYLRRGVDFWL